MKLSLILFLVCIPLGIILKAKGDSPQIRKTYIFMFLTFVCFLSTFRSTDVGSDTFGYFELAQDIYHSDMHELWYQTLHRYSGSTNTRDMGYFMLVKIIQFFTPNFIFLSFVLSLFYLIPFGKFLNRFSSNMMQLIFAFSLYAALFSGNTMCGSRQQVASGFTLLSLIAIADKKYVKSYILILLGSLMHQTALIFFAVPIVAQFFPKMVKKFHAISFFFIPVSILFASQIILLMANVSGNERYAVYGKAADELGGGGTFVVLLEFLSLVCYIGLKKNFLESNKHVKLLYVMTPFLTILGPLVLFDGAMMRLCKYFHLYLVLLVPNAIEQLLKKENVKTAYVMSIIVLLLLTISGSGGNKFEFIWNDIYYYEIV